MLIRDIFKIDIAHDINPVVQVSDQAPNRLKDELSSYVTTDVIERYLEQFLEHYAETKSKEIDQIGTWLYGFVGAGKSHFAKIIGLLLANPTIEGQQAIDLFMPRIQTCRRPAELERLLFEIKNNIDTEVISFNINTEANQATEDNICSIFYRVFYKHLGFSEDIRIALVEETLQRAEKYDTFKSIILEKTNYAWDFVRKQDNWDLYREQIFETLHYLMPDSYSSLEDAERAFDWKAPIVTFQNFAERVNEYISTLQKQDRGKVQRVLFVVDELGMFIAGSAERIRDVGTLVEAIGRVGKGCTWIFATGHYAVQDIVKDARGHQSDMLWVEGRFHQEFQLTSENIERVLEERLLSKNTAGEALLTQIFSDSPGTIREKSELSNPARVFPTYDAESFVSYYPFRPYQPLVIFDILQKFRTQEGKDPATSGAARSILGLTQKILQLNASREVGYLIPLDSFFESLQYGRGIRPHVLGEINQADQRMHDYKIGPGMILKTLYLIQQIDYVPLSPRNLALLAADNLQMSVSTFEATIADELISLRKAAYVEESPPGLFKYISGEERNDAKLIDERKAEVKLVELRQKLKDEFLNTRLLPIGVVRFEEKFNFNIHTECDGRLNDDGEFTNGHVIRSKGDLQLRIFSCLSVSLDKLSRERLEDASLREDKVIYWLSAESRKIEGLLRTLIATEAVMEPISLSTSESTERIQRANKYLEGLIVVRDQIDEEVRRGLRQGTIVYLGDAHTVDSNADINGIFNKEMSSVIPRIYSQFDKGKYRIEDEKKTLAAILAKNTTELHTIEAKLGLFLSDGTINLSASAVAEIYGYLERTQREGRRVSGQSLIAKFVDIPYGWDQNLARVVAAALFRGGVISANFQNEEYFDHEAAAVKTIFLDRKKFDASDLILNIEDVLSHEQLYEARQAAERIFEKRVAETNIAIADLLKKSLNALSTCHHLVAGWVEASRFPVSDAFKNAPEVIDNIARPMEPNKKIKRFLDNLEDVQLSVSSTKRLHNFYSSEEEKQKFSNLVTFRQTGHFLKERVDNNEIFHTVEALEFLERVWSEKTLLERFGEAYEYCLLSKPEFEDLYNSKREMSLTASNHAITRLEEYGKECGVHRDNLSQTIAPLQSLAETLKLARFTFPETKPSIQNLWDTARIDNKEDLIRKELEQMCKGHKEVGEVRRIPVRLRELPGYTNIIRSSKDLEKTLDSIKKGVTDKLGPNQEVELQ